MYDTKLAFLRESAMERKIDLLAAVIDAGINREISKKYIYTTSGIYILLAYNTHIAYPHL